MQEVENNTLNLRNVNNKKKLRKFLTENLYNASLSKYSKFEVSIAFWCSGISSPEFYVNSFFKRLNKLKGNCANRTVQ